MLSCKHCGNNKRIIKYGIKPTAKGLKQRWLCYSCKRYSFTPLDRGNNNERSQLETFETEQQGQQQLKQQHDKNRQRNKTYNQLIKLAGRAAYRATRR